MAKLTNHSLIIALPVGTSTYPHNRVLPVAQAIAYSVLSVLSHAKNTYKYPNVPVVYII